MICGGSGCSFPHMSFLESASARSSDIDDKVLWSPCQVHILYWPLTMKIISYVMIVVNVPVVNFHKNLSPDTS
jgi:hypothetical protein